MFFSNYGLLAQTCYESFGYMSYFPTLVIYIFGLATGYRITVWPVTEPEIFF